MSNQYLGEIRMFAGNFAPKGWALCDGQVMSIQQNSALFAILGTTYGGNGVTTFALPDLRSRTPMHWGQGLGLTNHVIGESSGVESVSVLITQLPMHTHLISVSNAAGTVTDPTGALIGEVNTGTVRSPDTSALGYAPVATGLMDPTAMATSGGSQPHTNMQPFEVVTFIIALIGIFPSRN